MIAVGASLQEQTFRLTKYVDLEDLRFLKLGTLAHNLVPFFLYRGLSPCFVHSRRLANVSDEAFGKGACLGFGSLPPTTTIFAKHLQEVRDLLSLLSSPLHL